MADPISNPTEDLEMKCLVVDDEENAVDGIVDYLTEIDAVQIIDTCFSAIEAMEVLKEKTIDLMFLDINMPRLSGLEFLESLQDPPIVILTTAYSEFALDAFKLNVADYLLKPYTFKRFFQAVQKAVDLYKVQQLLDKNESEKALDMYIRQEHSFHKINCEDLLFVEAMQNYMKLHFTNETFIIHQTMSTIEEMVPKDLFFRIHNSYLVNVTHIDSVSKSRLFIEGKEIPISKHRRKDFLNSIVYKNLISK